jgi:pimeloyl-ACP methyl ester carboxylesterase
MRGYGDSEKPSSITAYRSTHLEEDVLQLARALGRDKFTLVGRDWGAVLSWQIAAKHPDLIDKLIIVNGAHPSAWRRGIWGIRVQFFKAYYVFAFQIPQLPELIVYTGDNWRFDDLVGFLPKDEVEAYKFAYRTRGTSEHSSMLPSFV